MVATYNPVAAGGWSPPAESPFGAPGSGQSAGPKAQDLSQDPNLDTTLGQGQNAQARVAEMQRQVQARIGQIQRDLQAYQTQAEQALAQAKLAEDARQQREKAAAAQYIRGQQEQLSRMRQGVGDQSAVASALQSNVAGALGRVNRSITPHLALGGSPSDVNVITGEGQDPTSPDGFRSELIAEPVEPAKGLYHLSWSDGPNGGHVAPESLVVPIPTPEAEAAVKRKLAELPGIPAEPLPNGKYQVGPEQLARGGMVDDIYGAPEAGASSWSVSAGGSAAPAPIAAPAGVPIGDIPPLENIPTIGGPSPAWGSGGNQPPPPATPTTGSGVVPWQPSAAQQSPTAGLAQPAAPAPAQPQTGFTDAAQIDWSSVGLSGPPRPEQIAWLTQSQRALYDQYLQLTGQPLTSGDILGRPTHTREEAATWHDADVFAMTPSMRQAYDLYLHSIGANYTVDDILSGRLGEANLPALPIPELLSQLRNMPPGDRARLDRQLLSQSQGQHGLADLEFSLKSQTPTGNAGLPVYAGG